MKTNCSALTFKPIYTDYKKFYFLTFSETQMGLATRHWDSDRLITQLSQRLYGWYDWHHQVILF